MVCKETKQNEMPKDCWECSEVGCEQNTEGNYKSGARPDACRLFIRPDIKEARKILQACCDDQTLDFDQALRKLGYSKNSP